VAGAFWRGDGVGVTGHEYCAYCGSALRELDDEGYCAECVGLVDGCDRCGRQYVQLHYLPEYAANFCASCAADPQAPVEEAP
jgi:hypothetical protein